MQRLLKLFIFTGILLVCISLFTEKASAQNSTFSCTTYHEDGATGRNPIGSLNLDCRDEAWFWNNNDGRNDGVTRSCDQTFNDYINSVCPYGVNPGEPISESGFCGIRNGATAVFSCNPAGNFLDIGLRVKQADGSVARIAIEPIAYQSSPLKIAKNGVIYHVALVNPKDSYATKVVIKLSNGIEKALRIYYP